VIGEEELEEFIKDLDNVCVPATRFAIDLWNDYKRQLDNFFRSGAIPVIVYTGFAKYKEIRDFANKWDMKFKNEYGQGIVYLEGRSILCKITGQKPEPNELVWVKVLVFPIIAIVVGLDYLDVKVTLNEIVSYLHEYRKELARRSKYS